MRVRGWRDVLLVWLTVCCGPTIAIQQPITAVSLADQAGHGAVHETTSSHILLQGLEESLSWSLRGAKLGSAVAAAPSRSAKGSASAVFFQGFLVGAILCGIFPFLGIFFGRRVSGSMEKAMEDFDKAILGVEIDVGELGVNLWDGSVTMHGMTVYNPEGYGSEHLLKVRKIRADLRLTTLFFSCFRSVIITKLQFKGVDVIYDKAWRSSNLNDVINFKSRPIKDDPKRSGTNINDVQVTLHLVGVEDIGVKVASEMRSGNGNRIRIGNIEYCDFNKETGKSYINDVSQVILRSLLKTVVDELQSMRTKNVISRADKALSEKRSETESQASVPSET